MNGVSIVVAAREPLRRSLQAALTSQGYTVTASCIELSEALAAVHRSHPDVCVLDRELPGGGLAAIAALAGLDRRPKVIVVGGESAAEIRAARLAGAAACVSEEDLAATVAAFAGGGPR